jgi:hypothetical protein
MFNIVVIRVGKFSKRWTPLHVLRSGGVISQCNKSFVSLCTVTNVENQNVCVLETSVENKTFAF